MPHEALEPAPSGGVAHSARCARARGGPTAPGFTYADVAYLMCMYQECYRGAKRGRVGISRKSACYMWLYTPPAACMTPKLTIVWILERQHAQFETSIQATLPELAVIRCSLWESQSQSQSAIMQSAKYSVRFQRGAVAVCALCC